ncbi:MAG TPA: S53 family peptidase [Mycobacteriales bacterium]|nr:S53 family peptidase [Mycobacteriales bacterium]
MRIVGKKLAVVAASATFAIAAGVGLWGGTAGATGDPHNAAATSRSVTSDTAEQSPQLAANCAVPQKSGYAQCLALHTTHTVQPQTAAADPSGYGPTDLQAAYKVPSSGATDTVAIVDAYDNPNAEADLAKYRSQYGLPACTTDNGCFTKLNQNGEQGSYPSPDTGWAGEISLDVQMVSAVCPGCKIVLVEANSASFGDLGAAENTAASKATVISNSWGGGDADDATYGKYFNHQGVAITASSGDDGYQGGSYPASSSTVISVGGTSLNTASNDRGWDETVWDGTGSGCSATNAAIAGSDSADTGCGDKRAMNDVSAVADPNTGVAVYDTYGGSGWAVYGGTSASSPIVAALIGLSGKGSTVTPASFYGNPDAFFDVTDGTNGSCSPTQLCNARAGWDGPTGSGTPNGIAAF